MRHCVLVACVLNLAACASNPDIKVNYFPARSAVDFKVTRTVSCDSANNPIIANHVSATSSHSADYSKSPYELDLSLLDGSMSNSDFKFEFYPDGRLKAVNATTTGQGEVIIKSAISLIAAVGIVATAFPTECDFIRNTSPTTKSLTLTFAGRLENPQKGDEEEIKPELASEYYYNNLSPILGSLCATFASTSTATKPVVGSIRSSHTGKNKDVALTLLQPGQVDAAVRVGANAGCSANSPTIWEGSLVLAQFGVEYELPIPRAATFGKQVFALALDEAGALTTLQYAKNTGTSQVLNSGKGLADEFRDTTAEKAAAVKAEADLIAQQQRLVACRADPVNCK